LDLLGRGRRERLDERHLAGRLVVGDALADERLEFLGRRVRVVGVALSGTTNAFGISPQRSSGAGMTATSETASCSKRVSSSSIEEMFSPPETMMSFLRS